MNYFVRPVYNRPEMLQLSIESEIIAREFFYPYKFNITTIFAVEFSAPQKVLDIITSYPYPKIVIKRVYRHGDPFNQLEAIKLAGELTDSLIFYSTDDILIHKSYYKYIDEVIKNVDMSKVSSISAHNINGDSDPDIIHMRHHFSACLPVITKDFYDRYLGQCINLNYYSNKANFCKNLGNDYKNFWGPEGYKYKDSIQHHSWDGLCNRLTDLAMIEDQMYVVTPGMNRQVHIGFYGSNRRVGNQGIEGDTFEDRVNNLRGIVKDPKLMYDLSGQQYDDYKVFDKKLDSWNGTLHVK